MSLECCFILISSDLIASWKLLTASHCHRNLRLPVSSQLISSLLSFFTLSQLFAAYVFSPSLISSQLITTVLFSSHVIWACLISVHLSFSQLFLDVHSSSQLSAAHVSSSYVFSSPLSSSHIFKALLTPPQLISALVNSSHLISALLSNHLRSPLAENLLQKRILGAKASDPYAFHKEDLTQRSVYT